MSWEYSKLHALQAKQGGTDFEMCCVPQLRTIGEFEKDNWDLYVPIAGEAPMWEEFWVYYLLAGNLKSFHNPSMTPSSHL
jgi:hypothetical protein